MLKLKYTFLVVVCLTAIVVTGFSRSGKAPCCLDWFGDTATAAPESETQTAWVSTDYQLKRLSEDIVEVKQGGNVVTEIVHVGHAYPAMISKDYALGIDSKGGVTRYELLSSTLDSRKRIVDEGARYAAFLKFNGQLLVVVVFDTQVSLLDLSGAPTGVILECLDEAAKKKGMQGVIARLHIEESGENLEVLVRMHLKKKGVDNGSEVKRYTIDGEYGVS